MFTSSIIELLYFYTFERVDARRGLLYDKFYIAVAVVRRHGVYTITDFAIASRPGPVGIDAFLVSLPSVL